MDVSPDQKAFVSVLCSVIRINNMNDHRMFRAVSRGFLGVCNTPAYSQNALFFFKIFSGAGPQTPQFQDGRPVTPLCLSLDTALIFVIVISSLYYIYVYIFKLT